MMNESCAKVGTIVAFWFCERVFFTHCLDDDAQFASKDCNLITLLELHERMRLLNPIYADYEGPTERSMWP